MAISVCVFDAYGTLFDVTAAARRAAAEMEDTAFSSQWLSLAETWRRKQLEYTWLRALMPAHANFRQVTAEALDWALEAEGLHAPGLHDRIMSLYDRLDAYPEVPETLTRLHDAGLKTAILSNGSPDMLASAVASAGIDAALDAVLSVEAVGVFKPDPRVYALVTARFAVTPDQVLFVSSNGWDAAAAAGYGFVTLWVNRGGLPLDRLPYRPAHVSADLTTVPQLAMTA